MNQAQRNFLIDKIKKSLTDKIKELRENKPETPSVSNYLFHAVMTGDFDIKSQEEIKQAIKNKALRSKEGQNWLVGKDRWGSTSKNVEFGIEDIFILPPEYEKLQNEYFNTYRELEATIRDMELKADTLITRIQLASDKTLQRMINEVDDMGDISLLDSTLKLLNSSL